MMANGTDAEEKTATKVRPRLKRELEFLLRAHSEISAGMGRTRSGRSVAAPFPAPPRKRSKAVPSPARSPGGGAQADEEAESDIVELGSGDEEANSGVVIESVRVSEEAAGLVRGKVENRVARRSALKVKNEVEMEEADSGNERVKEVVKAEGPGNPDADYKAAKSGTGKKIPFELKELLDSGILEGTKLKYFRSSKTRASAGKAALEGVIKGSYILCFCEGCKGEKVVTPSVFELHARSLNKCPAEYIHLEIPGYELSNNTCHLDHNTKPKISNPKDYPKPPRNHPKEQRQKLKEDRDDWRDHNHVLVALVGRIGLAFGLLRISPP